MKVSVENNELVIRMPMGSPVPSATGKTLVVASTRGNIKTDLLIQGKPVTIGLNAYIPKS